MTPYQKQQLGLPLTDMDKAVLAGMAGTRQPQNANGANASLNVSGTPIQPSVTQPRSYGSVAQDPSASQAVSSVSAPTLPSFKNVGLQQFDVSTPQGRVNYFNAVQGQLQDQDSQIKSKYAQSLGSYDQQQGNLATSRSNYFNDLTKQGNDFNQSYDVGNVQRAQNYATLSPNAFQSSQATGQQYAGEQHLRGLADLQAAGSQAGTGFDQQQQSLDQGRQNLGTSYQNDRNAIATQLGGIRSGLDTYDASTSTYDPNRYKAAADISYSAPKVDLSGYNPSVSGVNSLASTPDASAAGKFSFAPTSSLTPQNSYFGYNPTGSDKDYITNYFRTGNINA